MDNKDKAFKIQNIFFIITLALIGIGVILFILGYLNSQSEEQLIPLAIFELARILYYYHIVHFVVGVALGLLIGLPLLTISLVGFVFGILSMTLTLLLARAFKNKNETILIMSGVIIGGFMTSILSIIKTIANTDTVLPNITYWLLGSFEKTVIKDVFIVAPIIIIGTVILLIMRWKVNVISLGYEEAITKGINYKRYRVIIIIIATLITAASVAFAGVIGWVGLVIPHIVRLVVGRNTKYTIPLSVTFGGVFMVLSDILSRSIFQAEIPLSAVTGFIGVPIFIIILVLSSNEVNRYD